MFKFNFTRTGIQAREFYPNGFGVSVIQSPGTYGSDEGKYELAVLKGNEESSEITYETDITNDVIGWLSLEEAREIADQVKNLHPDHVNLTRDQRAKKKLLIKILEQLDSAIEIMDETEEKPDCNDEIYALIQEAHNKAETELNQLEYKTLTKIEPLKIKHQAD